MSINKDIKILSNHLREVFGKVYEKLKNKNITDRSLDQEVLTQLKDFRIVEKNLKIEFSVPQDDIYNSEKGRTPYDLLCHGKINKKDFSIFINNKCGNLNAKSKNDITTYNNLLRLYLGIKKQRLRSKITIDGELIYNRIAGNEYVLYGVFIIDTKNEKFNFFLLEEIEDSFYVNPRNTMFQTSYVPKLLNKPIDFTLSLLS